MIIQETKPIARKKYVCEACIWFEGYVLNGFFEIPIKLSEAKLWIKAERENYAILPGTQYIKQRQIVDGDFFTFRARPEIDALCRKYELYNYV